MYILFEYISLLLLVFPIFSISIGISIYFIESIRSYIVINGNIDQYQYLVLPDRNTAYLLGYEFNHKCKSFLDIPLIKSKSNSFTEISHINKREYDTTINLSDFDLYIQDMNYYNKIVYDLEPLVINEKSQLISYSRKNSVFYPFDSIHYFSIHLDKFTHDRSTYTYHFTDSLDDYQFGENFKVNSKNMLYFCLDEFRLLKVDENTMLITYNVFIECTITGPTTIGFSTLNKLEVNEDFNKTDIFELSRPTLLMFKPRIHSIHNWMPFQYLNKTLFLASIEPFMVYKYDPTLLDVTNDYEIQSPTATHTLMYSGVEVSMFSNHSCINSREIPRVFPIINPTTPILYIRGFYLGFYQGKLISKNLFNSFPGYHMKSAIVKNQHSFGAFTFQLNKNDMKFKLTSISSLPIVSELFQVNEKGLEVNPLTFWLENNNEEIVMPGESEDDEEFTNIVLGVGYNGHKTIILKMNLNELLASLRPLNC